MKANAPTDIEKKIHTFWNDRARRFAGKDLVNVSNLEADTKLAALKHELESKVLMSFAQPKQSDRVLDLGAGHCAWSVELARLTKSVDAVEFSQEMVKLAHTHIRNNNLTNITVHNCAAQDFMSCRAYDLVLMSGLAIYLTDDSLSRLLQNLNLMTGEFSRLVLRDGTGREQAFQLIDKYSEELESSYSAYYRTRSQYKRIFEAQGYKLVRDQDMFHPDSPLNKRKETVLRIYLFEKSGR